MSAGLIFRWFRTGSIGNIQVTDGSSPSGNNLAFAFNSCSPRLQTLLRQVDIPPSGQIPVQFAIVFFNNRFVATNVDGPV
jgi:hypothetical protein